MQIRPFRLEDLDEATEVHCRCFPTSRATKLGRRYIRKMYGWFVLNYPDLSLVAIEGDHVVGLAVGSVGGYGRRVFRYALPEVLLGLLRHPSTWMTGETRYLWRSYLKAFAPGFKKHAASRSERITNAPPGMVPVAFASLAALESARGAGALLVLAFERAAKKRGAQIIMHTVRADNTPVRRMYDRLGWKTGAVTSVGASLYKYL